MKSVLNLILASYRYHALRSSLVFVALLVACAGLSAVLIINTTAQQSYGRASQPFVENVDHRIVARSGQKISKADYATLRKLGFRQLVAVQRKYANLSAGTNHRLGTDDLPLRIQLVGIDTFALLSLPLSTESTDLQNNSLFKISDLWRPPYATIIHPHYATELKLTAGQALSIRDGDGYTLGPLSLQGFVGLGREIVMDIAALHLALGKSELSELLVVGTGDSQGDALIITELRAALPGHLALESMNTGAQAQQLTASFHLNLLAMAMLMFVVCLFVVMNALHLLLIKRWHNLRITRQMGVSSQQIYLALLAELILISLLCAPLGTLLGAWLAQVLSPQVNQTLQSLFDVRVAYGNLSYFTLVGQSLLACLCGALAAAILPLWQLQHRLALRVLPGSLPGSQIGWLLAALLLGLGAGALAYLSATLLVSFMAIALLIFAGCSLLIYAIPLGLRYAAKLIPRTWHLLRWAFADSLRLSQSSKIANCAFFIALASNIGMNLMVDSFRLATEQWLNQRLIAEQYVRTSMPKEFVAWFEDNALPGTLIPRKNRQAFIINTELSHPDANNMDTTVEPKIIQLSSYPTRPDYQQAMLFARADKDVWQQFSSGQGILLNQQLALDNQLSLGQNINLRISSDLKVSKEIVGIYYDYGNQQSEALLPLTHFAQGESTTSRFALHFANEQQRQGFDLAFDASIFNGLSQKITSADLLALSMQTFDRTFVITDSLNIVTLLVAALSLATSVLMIDMDNRPQRALIRSLGVSNRQLTSLSLLQYTLLTSFSCLLALPFGIGLSWLLINLVNIQAFHWSYPMQIDSLKLIQACLFSLSLVLSVVLLPLYRLSRRTLLEDLKCLSH
ncbi:MAG: putative ABC transport system permease protein [Paraglaciecola sp.]|jgi:putative ABC transport system permease protein